jgi:hypothetical protein
MLAARIHAAHWSTQGATAGSRAIAVVWLAAAGRLREAICGLRGHDMVLHFGSERLSLECLACGARTQGWAIDVNPIYRRPRRQVVNRTVHRFDKSPSKRSGRRYDSDSSGEQLTAA